MVGFTEKKQGLHDVIASCCLVVEKNKAIKFLDNIKNE